MRINAPISECQKCGGPVWDDRDRKRNPKQPDFKCRDKEGCGEAYWLQGAARSGGNAGGSRGGSDPLPPLSFVDAEKLWAWAWAKSAAVVLNTVGVTHGADAASHLPVIQDGASSLFIALVPTVRASRKAKAKPAAPPPPPPPPEPEPAGLGDDDDLPF